MKLKLKDGNEIALPSGKKEAVRYIADLFRNQGKDEDNDVSVDWQDIAQVMSPRNKDAVSASEIRPLLSSAIQTIIREPIEPLMIITGLYNRVQAKGLHTEVVSGAIGAVTADDVSEHGTYPEVMFDIGGGTQVAYVGKSGIACSFTDEALRYSTWDIMSLNLRAMGKALTRHKEQKSVAFLRTLGTELYNNASPTTSLFGVCTGRGLDMTANGSLNIDDLFKAMAHMYEEGFAPDVLLVNPLFFYQFLQDPIMRNMMLAHGGGDYFNKWSGNPGPTDPWSNGAMGARGPSMGNALTPPAAASGETATGITGREHGMTSAFSVPGYFPWPFRVLVSPFVPFDATSQLGDIYLLSSGNVGFYLVDEDPVQTEWRDENVDVVKLKIKERYGFAVAHEGQGVGVMKNVKLTRNYWDGTVRAMTMDVDAEISSTATVL
jgi:hypothetical protein